MHSPDSTRTDEDGARFGSQLADLTDTQYLAELVRQIAGGFDLHASLVCEITGRDKEQGRIVAVFAGGRPQPAFRDERPGTPFAELARDSTTAITRGVRARFPHDRWLADHAIEACIGVPLRDRENETIGFLAALHDQPIDDPGPVLAALERVSRRASAELERISSSERLRARTRRLVQQNEVLRELARSPALAAGDRLGFASEAVTAACKTLEVERGSTWIFDDDRRRLRCFVAFAHGERSESEAPLLLEDCPEYFAALDSERVVATVDSRLDPRTRSLAEDYLIPLRIGSMLEAPIRSGGDFTGILCCEHVGEPRAWFDDEEAFVASLADLISLAFESADRRGAERETAGRNSELSALQRISELAIGAGSTSEGLLAVLAEIRRATGFPAASVQLTEAEGHGLVVKSGGNDARSIPLDELPHAHPSERKAYAVEHVDPELIERFPMLAEFGIGRFLSIPLASQRTVLGTLFLSDPEPGPIDERCVLFATSLGNALTAFLERQRSRQEEERIKVQLLQSRKLEAIGTLAAGIAHDFNNLLTGILGYAWRLKQIATPNDPVDQATSAIENAAERASELTHRLLGFARRGHGQAVPIELKDIAHEAAHLLDRTLDENVRVDVDFDSQRSTISADPGQIHLMLLNMAVNARDAMPNGGSLTFAVRSPEPRDGAERWVELEVLDTGTGIPEGRLDRVFEPFYTTKDVGEGTGMGLAMVYGIVQSHAGSIRVRNRPGGGACFHIRFPAAATGVTATPEERPVFGRGHILVVDDEDFARDAAAELMTSLGYTVTTASSGSEALSLFAAAPGKVDLVVLDIVMPRMGGRECLRALKRLDPHVRVVLASDWSLEGIGHLGLNQDALGLVEKPFQLVQLSQIVASVLDAPRDAPAAS